MTTTATTPVHPTGLAGEVLAEYGDRVVLHDLYDAVGAPVYHDLAAADTSEIREVLRVARAMTGPVLELASGSGRLTMPLLALGREVTALELKAEMLDLLRERLAAAPAGVRARCVPVQGDMAAFDLGRAFGLVVLGTTSVSLLDDEGRAGLFAAVRAHLAPGGKFLFSTVDMVEPEDGSALATDLDIEGQGASGRRYRMIEHWPEGAPARRVTILPPAAEARAADRIEVLTTSIRVLPALALERELADAGLRITARHTLPASGPRHRDVLLEAEAV
ncbi:daptide-type RiPP biosynthesis methyltransferase [Streptomyces sp. NPDC060198]|uniref:daptide-type RiPP biosynthesis methyltransferase n=1 Tax=Streptomyces sp. NPDC060198 TaxID=3347070 RepID=UPI0036566030